MTTDPTIGKDGVHATVIYGVKRFDVRGVYLSMLTDAEIRRFNARVDGSIWATLGLPVRRSVIPQTRIGNVVQFKKP